MIHDHHGQELAPDLHQGRHVVDAHQHLSVFLADLLTEAASAGAVRQNVPAKELARFASTPLAQQVRCHRRVRFSDFSPSSRQGSPFLRS